MPTYWWDGHPNFGDDMTPWLLPRLGVVPIHREPDSARLIGVGSILEFIGRDWRGAVWGSGLMHDRAHPLPHAVVLAVRGHLTAERIGASDPIAFGDPGILVSRFVATPRKRWDVALVPHGHHRSHREFLGLSSVSDRSGPRCERAPRRKACRQRDRSRTIRGHHVVARTGHRGLIRDPCSVDHARTGPRRRRLQVPRLRVGHHTRSHSSNRLRPQDATRRTAGGCWRGADRDSHIRERRADSGIGSPTNVRADPALPPRCGRRPAPDSQRLTLPNAGQVALRPRPESRCSRAARLGMTARARDRGVLGVVAIPNSSATARETGRPKPPIEMPEWFSPVPTR